LLYPAELLAQTLYITNIRGKRAPISFTGRGERIRTSDPLLPKQVRYQAAPRPEYNRINDLYSLRYSENE
jgi:hypothetical protein